MVVFAVEFPDLRKAYLVCLLKGLLHVRGVVKDGHQQVAPQLKDRGGGGSLHGGSAGLGLQKGYLPEELLPVLSRYPGKCL